MSVRKNFRFRQMFLFLVCFMSFNRGMTQSPSFSSYMNPVIPGDHPDATLTRIGNDFYTTGSSFNVTPLIFHSTDMVHWEVISQPVKASWSLFDDRPGGGCWGGHIVLYNGEYWDFFSRANTMYFVKASNPAGPWSEPVSMINPSQLSFSLGYDNSIFIDDDNRWYLLVKNGQPNGAIVELGPDGQPDGDIHNLAWLNPAPDFPYSWAEGPVMWKYKGYYYYSFARDLAGGQKVMRSQTLTAEESAWEMLGDFFNESDPLKPGSLFTSPNHASPVVMIDDSTHWVIHPLYAKGEWRGQGRQGLFNQVRYDENLRPIADYPINTFFDAPDLPGSGIPWMVPKSDFFTADELNPEWSFLGYTLDNTWSLNDRPGWLRLSPKSSVKANTVIKNDGEHNYSLITRVEFDPGSSADKAGLQIMRGDETRFVKLYSSVNEYNHDVIVFSFDDARYEADNIVGNIVWLKLVRVNHLLSAYFSKNGADWMKVGNEFDVSEIDSYSDFSSFTGTRQGLFVEGSPAYFDLYIYRDAYTHILAECPANQFGTIPTTKTDGIFQLDSIHNNDWALYAGVEFGNDEYPMAPITFQVTASSAGSGGTVELWLDSIDTGTKIADCIVSGTGDWNKFEVFTIPIASIQGRHDVYLRFTGASPGRLFKLKWIEFIANSGPELVSAGVTDDDTLQLKLNQPVVTPVLPSGFTIEANGSQDIPITAISLAEGDSGRLIVSLGIVVTNTDNLTISYIPGTIENQAGLSLISFSGVVVDNQLPGAVPKIKLLETRNEGDTVWMQLSKKMNSPAPYVNDFVIHIEGKDDIQFGSASLLDDDSATFILVPESRIYYEDMATLSYHGTSLESANGGALETFTSMSVRNTAEGYPPVITEASIRKYGSNWRYIDVTFNKLMQDASDETGFFTITLDNSPVTIHSIVTGYDSLTFSIQPYILFGDEIKLSYAGGNVRSFYNGRLGDFSDYVIANTIPEPVGFNPHYGSENSGIMIIPNPAVSEVQVAWETLFNELSVVSIDGRKCYHQVFNDLVKNAQISLTISPGIYFIILGNNERTGVGKMIVE